MKKYRKIYLVVFVLSLVFNGVFLKEIIDARVNPRLNYVIENKTVKDISELELRISDNQATIIKEVPQNSTQKGNIELYKEFSLEIVVGDFVMYEYLGQERVKTIKAKITIEKLDDEGNIEVTYDTQLSDPRTFKGKIK